MMHYDNGFLQERQYEIQTNGCILKKRHCSKFNMLVNKCIIIQLNLK